MEEIKKGSLVRSLDPFANDLPLDGVGLVTAYLPEMKTFAVFYGEGKWITYQDHTEEEFLKRIEFVEG